MSEIAEIELSLDHAKEMVEKKRAVLKLTSNREFKKIFMEGYFRDEAARLAGLSADPMMKGDRDEIILSIQGISLVQSYLRQIVRMGEVAEREIAEQTELLDELREQAEEEEV